MDIEKLQAIITKIVEDRADDLDRLIRLQSQYYNLLNEDEFPTDSKLPFPQAFAMVEENIPSAVEYLFPETNAIRLLPEEDNIDIDQLKKVEWGLHQMVNYRLPVKRQSAIAVTDCFKVGVGYTITEPCFVTPTISEEVTATDGKKTASERRMVSDKSKRSISYRHINVGQCLGYKDGSDTNGAKRSSTIIFLEFYTEAQIEAIAKGMGDRRGTGALTKAYKASKDEKAHESISSWLTKIAELHGPIYTDDGGDEDLPTLIPVVKVYQERAEAWLSFGTDIIYEKETEHETLRCPITKWTSVLDGDEWYPMSLAEALEKPHLGTNIWINMVYDAMSWNLNRPMVYSKEMYPDGAPEYDLRAQIGVQDTDVAKNAVAFLDGPQISSDTFAVGDRLQEMTERIGGRKDLTGKNYARGGANAFQELRSSVSGRERMAGWIFETGAMEEVHTHILIEMQAMDEDMKFFVREFDDDGKDGLNTSTVTLDDLRHAYTVTLSLKDKYAAGSLSVADRTSMYNLFKEDPYFDPKALREFVLANDDWAKRMMIPKNQVDTVQTQERNAQLLGRALSSDKQMNASPPAEGAMV